QIIGWINSDDYYQANIFKYVVDYFEAHPEVDMIYGRCFIVDGNRNFIMDCDEGYAIKKCGINPKIFNYKDILEVTADIIPQPSVFFRRDVFWAIGYLDESFNYVMDYEYWLRI